MASEPAVQRAESTVDGRSARAQLATARRTEMILDSLEQLLSTTKLRDIGVDDIAQRAGITRGRFYSYYKSKDEAYAALLNRVSSEIIAVYDSPEGWLMCAPEGRPKTALMATVRNVAELWLRHGPALREASDLWNAVTGVRECWYAIIYGLADRVANAISRDRRLGLAPPGPDAQAAAQGLIWMGERILFLQISDAPRPLTIDAVVDVGTSIWMRTIYLSDDPDPVNRDADRPLREQRKRRR